MPRAEAEGLGAAAGTMETGREILGVAAGVRATDEGVCLVVEEEETDLEGMEGILGMEGMEGTGQFPFLFLYHTPKTSNAAIPKPMITPIATPAATREVSPFSFKQSGWHNFFSGIK